MFEVLVFVYENYWRGDACPEWEHLERKLNAVGFEAEEIQEALTWLSGLSLAAQGSQIMGHPPSAGKTPEMGAQKGVSLLRLPEGLSAPTPVLALHGQSSTSMRVYSISEQNHMGSECLGFLTFLESAGVLSASMREIVVDRAMAAPGDPVCLDDLKIIILMVYWSLGEEPDALVLDELCDDATDRIAH
jgi:Smg protein